MKKDHSHFKQLLADVNGHGSAIQAFHERVINIEPSVVRLAKAIPKPMESYMVRSIQEASRKMDSSLSSMARVVQAFPKALESSIARSIKTASLEMDSSVNKIIREALTTLPTEASLREALSETDLWQGCEQLHQKATDIFNKIDSEQLKNILEEIQEVDARVNVPYRDKSAININATLVVALPAIEATFTGTSEGLSTDVALAIQEQTTTFAENAGQLLVQFEAQKNPLLQNAIITLFLLILFAYFNPIAAHQVETFLNKSEKKQISKQTNRTVTSLPIDRTLLNLFRQVDADILHVRKRPNRSGEILGDLRYGQTVQIVKKQKNWTLARWENGETSIEGWVFTRYLKRFK